MARLTPYPFGALVRRMFREVDRRHAIFDLPARAFFRGDAGKDLSVCVHGQRAATPFGPAAGPHSQLAQNIVLSWLGGGRLIELKTVQHLDQLSIPRPCIDVQTVGFNVEWSQELRLEESLEEYVKAWMLIRMLTASGKVPLAPGAADTVFDMSVGYNLAGIRSERVQTFMRGLMDAQPVIDRLRGQIPDEYRHYRDLDYDPSVSRTLTLSTFHGCPCDEIDGIVDFLLREVGLNVCVKLNPTLLGRDGVQALLHDRLGYRELAVPDEAFEQDLTWDAAVGMVEHLAGVAKAAGRGLGVKFSNTLIVKNHRTFFPADQARMYLSGPPLHVLAMTLVGRFRETFGDRFPVSFSGGIDRTNFADAVAMGLVPVTVCTDLLKPGGYSRARGYLQALKERMEHAHAGSVGDFIIRTAGADAVLAPLLAADDVRWGRVREALAAGGDLRDAVGDEVYEAWRSRAVLHNTARYAARVADDPHYAAAANSKPPRKIGHALQLFDCISCDKCVPVCPNDANFTFVLPQTRIPVVKLEWDGVAWRRWADGAISLIEPHQIGTFADFCNECGNCDVFCPEDGGPYRMKPRLFGTLAAWREQPALEGFFAERRKGTDAVFGRFEGREFEMTVKRGRVEYAGAGFRVRFAEAHPDGTIDGDATAVVDLTYFHIMNLLRRALLTATEVNYINSL
mgnify:CR=1 FL=1